MESADSVDISFYIGKRSVECSVHYGRSVGHIYRVSQKKGGLVFRARFEVFRGFKSKKFRRLTPIKI